MVNPGFDKFSLGERVAVVTGAGQGIGRGIALAFADAGAAVIIAERNPETTEAVVAEVHDRGRRALGVVTDARRSGQVAAMVERTLGEFGRIDILVNNAGGGFPHAAFEISENGWDAIITENLKSTFLCCRKVGEVMRDQGRGAIINIASIAGLGPTPGRAAYGAAKAGIINLTQSLAVEWGRYGIRVNAIAPGRIDTPGSAGEGLPQDSLPIRRVGKPEDIAYAAVYLASDASEFVTGSVLVVGGLRG